MSERSSSSHARDTLPMSVANMTFMVNRLGEDCSPLQFVRELTQNAVEGILQLAGMQGEVVWDVFWPYKVLDDNSVYKLCCIDTGAGMTGEEMARYINKLSSSIHEQSAQGNFGVGAKIAAAPRNPHGLVYLSWKEGRGYMIHLWFDPIEQVYGLRRFPQNNGEFWCYIDDDLKPQSIKDHGTVVILLGQSDDDNTMEPPDGTPMRSKWMLRYLNTRYFRFPNGITVKAREGWEVPRSDSRHNFLREVHGQARWLEKNSASAGRVALDNATCHWWILKEDVDADSGHYAPGGHVAALHVDELYELVTGRGGMARLQAFGVIFGTDRVVIYVEPRSSADSPVVANTARTQLMANGHPLPWAEWAGEFRNNLPEEIIALQDEIGAKSGQTDHKKAIRERLKQIKDLLRFSRYRPSDQGKFTIDPGEGGGGLTSGDGITQREREHRPAGSKAGRSGDIFALFAQTGAETGDPIDSSIEPNTRWVSEKDVPLLRDRAAQYTLDQNLLLINTDFRAFTDMTDRWVSTYSAVPGARKVIEDVVHEWFEQQLIETVMSALALRKAGSWSLQELQSLWSPEALTAAVLPRWHIDQIVKRMLGHRLGTSKAA